MIDTSGITYNLDHYDWLTVFAISGLCYEDFLYDSTGDCWEEFIKSIEAHNQVLEEVK